MDIEKLELSRTEIAKYALLIESGEETPLTAINTAAHDQLRKAAWTIHDWLKDIARDSDLCSHATETVVLMCHVLEMQLVRLRISRPEEK